MKRSLFDYRWAIAERIAKVLPFLLLSGLILGHPGTAVAQTTSNWTGSTSSSWGDGTNWDNGVPNSSTVTAVITNTTNNPVVISGINPTIANLTLGTMTTHDNLQLNNAQNLTIAGGAGAGSIAIATGSTFTLNSAGSLTDLNLAGTSGSTITLSGGGTLALSNSGTNRIYSTSGDTLVNSAGNTIQGSGQVGVNAGGYTFTLNNNGTIDAKQAAALQIATGTTTTNTGTLEATAGGTLNLAGTFTNTGATILSDGGGSTVNLGGGPGGSTIDGGTLTTTNGGAMTIGGSTLNGVTISSGSAVRLDNGTVAVLQGKIANGGTIAMNSGGSLTDLQLSGAVTLSGGTVSMSNNAANRIYGITGSDSLTNNGTIQGSGQVGINAGGYSFTLNNNGTIDANQSAALQVAPTIAVTNNGTLEATAGGTLVLTGGTFNNSSTGVILSKGSGSTVDLSGSTITGGTLTTTGGGVIQNNGTATFDGTTSAPTISVGSTITLDNSSTTVLKGTITNNGTIATNSAGSLTDILLSGPVTLSGKGALVMSDNNANRIYGVTGDAALTNGANHTIEGGGQIGVNNGGYGFTLTNNGTILANATTTLSIAPTGNTTNNGTFQANSGSTLFMNGPLTNYSPATSTLTGGTYNAFSGTIALSQANATAGTPAVIATNAATILLDGSTAKISDGTGQDIVRGFLSSNTAAGSFTIQNGANVTTASTGFTNAGTVNIGANSTFTVGGSHDYVQSGGITTLSTASGSLVVSPGHAFDLDGGTLQGIGTITGDLVNTGGTVMPGNVGSPGTLTVTGNYSDPFASMDIQIDFSGAGLLDLGGSAKLSGTTLEISLLRGFLPINGASYEIVATAGGTTDFANPVIVDGNITFTAVVIGNDVFLDVSVASVPEPASIVMLGLGMAGVGTFLVRRSRKAGGR